MKYFLLPFYCFIYSASFAQYFIDTTAYHQRSHTTLTVHDSLIDISWPSGEGTRAGLSVNMAQGKPLLQQLRANGNIIAQNLDPAFILTVGKRDLISQNGWNIFFDKVPQKPHESYVVKCKKDSISIRSEGAHTVIRMATRSAATFIGALEITLYNGSPLLNIAAVMSTTTDSTAIVYDAGLMSDPGSWKSVAWSNTADMPERAVPNNTDSSLNLAVKYRTIIGESERGSLAVFPAPHQYFYPLDEAFNLSFTWFGAHYRNLLPGFGMGIRQELEGDKRYVPWFNAPPHTEQRLHFFCLLSAQPAEQTLALVKLFTHNDTYKPLPGYKTMSSHFHNEFIMNVVMKGLPLPEHPSFVDVLKKAGINIVHLAEFHYTAHPKGPDEQRLAELKALYDQCRRLSGTGFLLLPGEEPNEFFGGHWLSIFPKPVYWIMSRQEQMPYVKDSAGFGKVYRIKDSTDMLRLLREENGLAWTAHARTKGSTGYPDTYKNASFFQSDRFLGAAWKAMPADLSLPKLGVRVLDLMDDMNNWGYRKQVIGEADLFTIEPENEMYAHLNINYLSLPSLPSFEEGWQPVLSAMRSGKFFTTTGEVLLPFFTVNGTAAGHTASLHHGSATIELRVDWTFPLSFAEIISGDGKHVFRERIDLSATEAFGSENFEWKIKLAGKKWVRAEVWDVAANGAFTQTVWL